MSTPPVPPAPANEKIKIQERKLWRSGEPPEYVETMPQNEGSPLDQLYKRMKQYDQDMCSGWRDEIEHLLIFAGLFSATVTAFLVDSYKWLKRDNTDVSARILSQVSLQLSAMATNGTAVPPSTALAELFTPTSGSVRINIFWFTSLVMCLSTVIFGILCLQWIGEYTRDISLSPADAITIRQMRYDGLFRWRVPTVVAWLPAILQTSVLLFFAGVLDLLWSVHDTVATVITVFVGLTAAAILFTTAAPVIQTTIDFHHFARVGNDPQTYVAPCPYRSPISWIVLRLVMILDPVLFKQRSLRSSWADFDIFSHESSMKPSQGRKTYNAKGLARALRWIMDKLSPELNQDIPRDVYHSLHDAVDRPTAGAVLLDWAQLTGEARNLKTTLEELRRPGMYQARYDLLMERLLRKSSPVQENRKLLLELQVRCLNTLGDNKMADMGETFSEAARNCYYYTLENKGGCSLDNDGLLFQSLMTLMKFYNNLYDQRRMHSADDYVGSVLDQVIRWTQVNDTNVSLCYQVLNQFKSMLEGVHECAGDDFSYPVPNQNLRSTVQLLHRLDLHAVKKWETSIQNITGNSVSLVDGMIPFMERLAPEKEADEVKGQLDAFHKSRSWRYDAAF